jgi:hypothetical protein
MNEEKEAELLRSVEISIKEEIDEEQKKSDDLYSTGSIIGKEETSVMMTKESAL